MVWVFLLVLYRYTSLLLQTSSTEEWRKPQHFVPRDNSVEEWRLQEIRKQCKLQAENLQYKRQLEAILIENAVLKKVEA